MHLITRKLEFDAGHRLMNHEGKCRHYHGHRYSAEFTVTAPDLDLLGRVIDFSVIKTSVGNWIDYNLDHNMILNMHDPLLQIEGIFKGRGPYILQNSENPTAENIAKLLFDVASRLLPPEITVIKVRLYETPNCWADYTKIVK